MTAKEWRESVGWIDLTKCIDDLEAAEKERDSLMRSIESWKLEEAEWEKERAGWLVTLDKSEHEGMKWKDRAENAERERSAILAKYPEPAVDMGIDNDRLDDPAIYSGLQCDLQTARPAETTVYVCRGCGTVMGTSCFEHLRNGEKCGSVEQRRK